VVGGKSEIQLGRKWFPVGMPALRKQIAACQSPGISGSLGVTWNSLPTSSVTVSNRAA